MTNSLESKLVAKFSDGNIVHVGGNLLDPSSDWKGDTLNLYFSNESPSAPLVPDNAKASSDPTFTISFRSGKGQLRLASKNQLEKISIEVLSTPSNYSWKVAKNKEDDEVTWTLKPENSEILGVGANASVTFKISGIKADSKPGRTRMNIDCENIPGYEDYSYELSIKKESPIPNIMNFAPVSANLKPGEPAQLKWSTFDIDVVELTYSANGDTPTTLTSENDEIKLNQSSDDPYTVKSYLKGPTTFSLQGYSGKGEEKTSLDSCFSQTTITPLEDPKITKFNAELLSADNGEGQVKFSWEVEHYPDYITISSASKKDYKAIGTEASRSDTTIITSEVRHTLKAWRKGKPKSCDSRDINVTPTISDFTANPPEDVEAGNNFTLSWQAHYGICQISNNVGHVETTGTRSIKYDFEKPTVSYTLTAKGVGSSPSQTVRIDGEYILKDKSLQANLELRRDYAKSENMSDDDNTYYLTSDGNIPAIEMGASKFNMHLLSNNRCILQFVDRYGSKEQFIKLHKGINVISERTDSLSDLTNSITGLEYTSSRSDAYVFTIISSSDNAIQSGEEFFLGDSALDFTQVKDKHSNLGGNVISACSFVEFAQKNDGIYRPDYFGGYVALAFTSGDQTNMADMNNTVFICPVSFKLV